MAGAGDSLLLKHITPAAGVVVACVLFLSPLKAVLAVRQARSLGSLNPLPMVAIWANCTAWLVYAFLTHDPYVLASNVPGLLLGAFMTLSCYGHADDNTRLSMMRAVMAFCCLLMAAGAWLSFATLDAPARLRVWGSVTVLILLLFYAAPLSALAEVLRSRSAATLHAPLAGMSCFNGLLWSVYGAALGDAFIYAPNMVGAAFGALQLLLCWLLPSKPSDRYLPATCGDGPDSEMADARTVFDACAGVGGGSSSGGGSGGRGLR